MVMWAIKDYSSWYIDSMQCARVKNGVDVIMRITLAWKAVLHYLAI